MINKCVESVLLDNYFLHFAGSWHESNMWKNDNILNKESISLIQNFASYLNKEVTGNPIGVVKP